jgi:dTDP-glucose 4,6-dehydratase
VQGFLSAGSVEGIEGHTFNLGTGQEIRIGELARKIIAIVGRPVHIEIDEQRLRPARSEVTRLISDNQQARVALNWVPQISLDEGLSCTVAWIRENLAEYRPGVYEF